MKALTVAQSAPSMAPDAPPSKSALKRHMLALQAVGEALVDLSAEQLRTLELSDDLRSAVIDAKRISKHGGRKRQMQYIGRLMRNLDAAPVVAQLQALRQPARLAVARQQLVAAWRDRLLLANDADAALDALISEYPRADRSRLRGLVVQARQERASRTPPHAFREMFHALSSTLHAEVSADDPNT
jgi:ribosome-associated protein